MKNSRFLLLKNKDNLSLKEKNNLTEVLELNKPLFKAYILRDGIKHLWSFRYRGYATKWFEDWYSKAIRSKVQPIKKIAKMIKRRIHGVLSHYDYPMSNSVIEGMMNKIKVIKRVVFGYRDIDYFFLRIRGYFTGTTPQ